MGGTVQDEVVNKGRSFVNSGVALHVVLDDRRLGDVSLSDERLDNHVVARPHMDDISHEGVNIVVRLHLHVRRLFGDQLHNEARTHHLNLSSRDA